MSVCFQSETILPPTQTVFSSRRTVACFWARLNVFQKYLSILVVSLSTTQRASRFSGWMEKIGWQPGGVCA